MYIKAEGCRQCPFLGEEEEQKICNLIHWIAHTIGDIPRTSWKDDKGFDELYEEGTLPKSCPLRIEEITVTIEKEP